MRSKGLVVALSAVAAAQSAKVVVNTHSGMVRGVIDGDIRAFRRIPFAAPPVGHLRWRLPAPPTRSGIRDTLHFGKKCPQMNSAGHLADGLFLNVFTSARRLGDEQEEPGQAVMVFFHGGGNKRGSSQQPPFNDPLLASHGVIVVTAEYRLGALGFFTHPFLTIEGGGSSCNYGLMDQIAALARQNRADE